MLTGKYLDTIQDNGYIFLNEYATRVTHQSGTCIDHMNINDIDSFEFSVMQESFLEYYHLSMSCRQKSLEKSERDLLKHGIFEKFP